MAGGFGGGDRKRRDLHRVHCRGCDDAAHEDTGPVSADAAREALRGVWPDHPDVVAQERMDRHFG